MAEDKIDNVPGYDADLDQADEQLLLSTAVENAAEAIVITDPAGYIRYVNPAFEQITGFTRAEVIDRHISLLDSGKQDKSFFKNMWQTLRQGNSWKGRFTNKKKDGTLYDAEATISPAKNKAGEVSNYVSVQRDVSHEVQLQRQLRQAQKMEAIGTLAGGIAHDFNNLLMGIQGNVSLSLLEMEPDTPLYQNLRKIEEYVANGVELTKQLLGFARGGKYEVRLTDINQLLKEQSLLLGRANKRITFKEEYAPDLYHIEADKSQIEQVIFNLFMNALQAMPREGTLTARTENTVFEKDAYKPYRVKAGRYVKISVADTGEGMDEKTQRRIFDPFFTTRDKGRGTGLGLAAVYGIVKNHEGFIDVVSSRGQGTRFDVFFPASQTTPSVKQIRFGQPKQDKETVLLVDDEEMITDVGSRMLAKLGFDVLIARDGEEAVSVYQDNQGKINLVLLDMVMPRVGGGEAFDRLKQINPDVKVILCSGYSIDGQARVILNRGCSAFIQKPFNLKTLSDSIRTVLNGGN